jgi:hypothetical protein
MKTTLLFVLSFAAFASSLSSQVLGARAFSAGGNKAAATAPAPATARAGDAGTVLSTTPVTVTRRFMEWDGFPITKLVLTFDRNAAIEIGQPRLADWQRRDRAPFALGFVHPLAPEACLGISYFSGRAASNLLAGTAWSSAPSSLPRNPKGVSRVLVNDDSAVNTNMLRPLGWRTRVFEREITSSEPDTPPQRQVLVAIGDDTQAYLFTLEGNSSHVAQLKDAFERTVTGFEIVH